MRVKMEYHPIYIDFQFISSELMPTAVHDLHGLEAIFRRTLKHWLKGSKSSMLCCMGGLYEIYGKMMEQRRTGYISEESRALARRAEAQMIERLSDRNLKMTEIAEHIGISTAHLRRIFYATFGVAPNSYLQQKRIQKARLLLLESDFSMEQIAEATGFCNAYYFSRVFRSFNGMPPGAYRQENGR